jgi:hypothetical protein
VTRSGISEERIIRHCFLLAFINESGHGTGKIMRSTGSSGFVKLYYKMYLQHKHQDMNMHADITKCTTLANNRSRHHLNESH